METTWDGAPVAREPPFGCMVVVWRQAKDSRQYLLLHRRAAGPREFQGDWAWTPPSGARQPGETPENAAGRELLEETGLVLQPHATTGGSNEWFVFHAEAPSDAVVVLDEEHDRYEWVDPVTGAERCLPVDVGAAIAAVERALRDAEVKAP